MLKRAIGFLKGNFLRRFKSRETAAPGVLQVRVNDKKAVILLIHGYTGASDSTWQPMIDMLLRDETLKNWDIVSLGYATSLRIDIPGLWSADPSLSTLSSLLSTAVRLPPLSRYRAIAVVTHSMGGLIAQRCICDDADLRGRLSHLFLYGVPSLGLIKAGYFGWVKRQLSDMGVGSCFIAALRRDWEALIGTRPSFVLRCVAGDRDEFVGGSTSLQPFASEFQRVVPGNHSTVISPSLADDQRFTILSDGLSGRIDRQTVVDGAEVAVELRRFHEAVGALWENREALDQNARVTLSLALEGVGRRSDAIEVLRAGGVKDSDVVGTLAGRLKRRWLTERVVSDWQSARELYLIGLELARSSSDWSQVYYHAINVCFLDLMAVPESSEIPTTLTELANEALDACGRAPDNVWTKATIGEANLYLNNLDAAILAYHAALESASPREVHSFVSQARLATGRIFGRDGLLRLERELNEAGRVVLCT